MTYAVLPMPLKTTIVTFLFLTMATGICVSILVGKKQGRVKQILLSFCTLAVSAIMLLYASVIRAERAPAHIPAVSLWFVIPIAAICSGFIFAFITAS